MRATENRILAFAARYGRIAYVYFKDGQPKDWALSCKGAKSGGDAASMARTWIARFDPDVVIIEDPTTAKRKGPKTRSLIQSMLRVSERSSALVAKTERTQNHCNKFDEAGTLAETYPQLASKVPPKRRLWDPEHRNLVFFEAIALAQFAGFLSFDDVHDRA